jgi:hypothetical protein
MQLRGIKLALVDDAKKLTGEFSSVLTEIDKNGVQLAKLDEIVQRYGERGLELFKNAQNITDKLESAYKALGVDPNLSNEYKSLIKQMDTLLTYRKRYSF